MSALAYVLALAFALFQRHINWTYMRCYSDGVHRQRWEDSDSVPFFLNFRPTVPIEQLVVSTGTGT